MSVGLARLGWTLLRLVAEQQPAAAELQWVAPPSCPSASDVAARIAQLAPSAPVSARVEVTSSDDRFVARIDLDGGGRREHRTLSAGTCEAIADAVAVVIAIGAEDAIELPRPPDVASSTDVTPAPEPAPSPPPSEPTQPPRTRPSEPPRPIRPPRRALIGLAASAQAGITTGLAPGVVPTIAGSFAVLGPRWRAELLGIGTTRGELRFAEPASVVSAEIRSFTAQLRGAWVPGWRAIELPVHGGVDVGVVWARARGGVDPGRGTMPRIAVLAGGGLSWVIRPWIALRIEGQGAFVVLRHRFSVLAQPAPVVFTPARWAVRVLFGPELRIPPGLRRTSSRNRGRRGI